MQSYTNTPPKSALCLLCMRRCERVKCLCCRYFFSSHWNCIQTCVERWKPNQWLRGMTQDYLYNGRNKKTFKKNSVHIKYISHVVLLHKLVFLSLHNTWHFVVIRHFLRNYDLLLRQLFSCLFFKCIFESNVQTIPLCIQPLTNMWVFSYCLLGFLSQWQPSR